MEITNFQVLQRVWKISQKRQHGIFRVRYRDPRLLDFLINLAECQAPAGFRFFHFKASGVKLGLMRQLGLLQFDPANFKLVFLPGKLLLLGTPLPVEALFRFDGALFTLKAQGVAEGHLKIFEELPGKNAHALDFDGLHGNPQSPPRRRFPL